MEFGQRFKKLLKEKKVTQTQFANDIGIHAGLLSSYLSGLKPSVDFIYKAIAYFPDTDLNYLFGDVIERSDYVSEADSSYKKGADAHKIIKEIEKNIEELKRTLPQK